MLLNSPQKFLLSSLLKDIKQMTYEEGLIKITGGNTGR